MILGNNNGRLLLLVETPSNSQMRTLRAATVGQMATAIALCCSLFIQNYYKSVAFAMYCLITAFMYTCALMVQKLCGVHMCIAIPRNHPQQSIFFWLHADVNVVREKRNLKLV